MTRERTLIWLDLVRGTSAIAVCAGHLRNATLRNYVELHGPNIFQKFLYIITGLVHQAVMVFRGGAGFSDRGISGIRAGSNRRSEVHEEAQTEPFRSI